MSHIHRKTSTRNMTPRPREQGEGESGFC